MINLVGIGVLDFSTNTKMVTVDSTYVGTYIKKIRIGWRELVSAGDTDGEPCTYLHRSDEDVSWHAVSTYIILSGIMYNTYCTVAFNR